MTKEEHYLNDKFMRLIKERKKNPKNKEIKRKLSAVWAKMHAND